MNQTALPQREAAPGHNLPPEVESTFDQLSARTSALVENANRWANERPIIETETDSIKGGDFLDQLRTQIKEIEDERKARKKPHSEAATKVDAKYNPLKRPVEIAGKLIKGLLDVWLDKQREIQQALQRQAEEVARKAEAEALARLRAAEEETGGDVVGRTFAAEEAETRAKEVGRDARRAAAPPKVASAFGGRSKSQRSRTVVEIEDATKIPAKVLRRLCARVYVTEALQRAVREDVSAYSEKTEGGGLVSTVPGIIVRVERTVA